MLFQLHPFPQWKGTAAYYNFQAPGSTSSSLVANRIWTYKTPTPTFKPIAGYLSFYASSGKKEGGDWYCEVAGERVVAQDGDVSSREVETEASLIRCGPTVLRRLED